MTYRNIWYPAALTRFIPRTSVRMEVISKQWNNYRRFWNQYDLSIHRAFAASANILVSCRSWRDGQRVGWLRFDSLCPPLWYRFVMRFCMGRTNLSGRIGRSRYGDPCVWGSSPRWNRINSSYGFGICSVPDVCRPRNHKSASSLSDSSTTTLPHAF